MNHKVIYPVILEKTSNKKVPYIVILPDFDGMTQGYDLANALYMAEDYISLTCVYLEDEGRALPEPTPLNEVPVEEGQMRTLIVSDLDSYRAMLSNLTVRKNVTIPAWLNEAALKLDINFSKVLVDGLKKKIGISSKEELLPSVGKTPK